MPISSILQASKNIVPSAHSQGVAAAAGIRRRIAGSLMQGGVHAWNVILLDYSWITGRKSNVFLLLHPIKGSL